MQTVNGIIVSSYLRLQHHLLHAAMTLQVAYKPLMQIGNGILASYNFLQ